MTTFLQTLPLVFVLAGVVLYAVLGGADFGAGAWQLLAGRGAGAQEIREHAHHSMGPVWEANHVWLIFVLTVFWTGYPVAFGSIASTLAVPLFIAGLGIILRGAAYALRVAAVGDRELARIDTVFAVSSILTPFMLGAVVGAIACNRVPVGNAAGGLISSWTGPVSILIGIVAVSNCAYLAAVYLAADATRNGEPELEREFRARALIAGVLAGAVALAGLIVLRSASHHLFERLLHSSAVVALIVSGAAGITTLSLVWTRRLQAARFSAALAVAAVIAGWGIASFPHLLPGLTVHQAAAPHDTLVALLVAVLGGGTLLFPSLALLFSLTLGGRLRSGSGDGDARRRRRRADGLRRPRTRRGRLSRLAGRARLGGAADRRRRSAQPRRRAVGARAGGRELILIRPRRVRGDIRASDGRRGLIARQTL